jgi:hypothetical protein
MIPGRTEERPTNRSQTNPPGNTPERLNVVSRGRPKKKPGSWSNPAFWKAVDSFTLYPKEGPASATESVKSIVQPLLSEVPSRTPSQSRALELYLQATQSLPKQPLALSLSATSISVKTVEEPIFKQDEFHAADLATTSTDRQRKSPSVANLKSRPPLQHH